MKRFAFGCGVASLASLAIGLTAPARADFFTLDGRFECLDRSNAICGDAQPLASMQPAAKPAPVLPVAPVAQPLSSIPTARSVMPSPRAEDPLRAIAQRVQADAPASGDLVWLKQAAQSGNPRAIELLAWCDLNAVGTPRDPVQAYLLYGAAADAALPHARENQTLIYERDLDKDQRQKVLDLVNEGAAFAQISPAAQ
jgi:hypothetical protein